MAVPQLNELTTIFSRQGSSPAGAAEIRVRRKPPLYSGLAGGLSSDLWRLVHFFGLAGFSVHFFPDHSLCDFRQISHERRIQLLKLRPQDRIDKGPRRLDDDALTMHPTVPKGAEAVTSTERRE